MAKKVNCAMNATVSKSPIKGSAWLVRWSITEEGSNIKSGYGAWTSASAAKRAVKEIVLSETPKKSIKWVAGHKLDVKGKPMEFTGSLVFKLDVNI